MGITPIYEHHKVIIVMSHGTWNSPKDLYAHFEKNLADSL